MTTQQQEVSADLHHAGVGLYARLNGWLAVPGRPGLMWKRGITPDREPVNVYRPSNNEMTVDGITYRPDPLAHNDQTMIALKNDNEAGGGATCRMRCDRPPTEAELDWWCNEGDTEDPF